MGSWPATYRSTSFRSGRGTCSRGRHSPSRGNLLWKRAVRVSTALAKSDLTQIRKSDPLVEAKCDITLLWGRTKLQPFGLNVRETENVIPMGRKISPSRLAGSPQNLACLALVQTLRANGNQAQNVSGIDRTSHRTENPERRTRKHVPRQRHGPGWEACLRCHCETDSRHARHARDEHGGDEGFASRCLERHRLFGQGEYTLSRSVECQRKSRSAE